MNRKNLGVYIGVSIGPAIFGYLDYCDVASSVDLFIPPLLANWNLDLSY